ncbi:hypothetical protein HZS_3024 [Henneguya salminicola]|nr:hypothetical protein HZS_3024 [Henneguya salminicola]
MAEVAKTQWNNLSEQQVFGLVISNYNPVIKNHCLKVKVGDLVRIYEECGEWYRCRLIRGENNSLGIIPKCYAKLTHPQDLENLKNKNTHLKLKNKIWITLQRVVDCLFVKNQRKITFSKIIGKIRYLIGFSNKLNDSEQIELLKTPFYKCPPGVFKIRKYINNKSLCESSNNDLFGNAKMYEKLFNKNVNHPFHFLLKLLRINFQSKGDFFLEIMMIDQSSMTYISENYFYPYNIESGPITIDNENPIIFTNFSVGDLTSGALLLIKVFEESYFVSMLKYLEKFFTEKEKICESFNILVGLTVLNLKIFHHDSKINFYTFRLPVISVDRISKECVEEIIIDLVNDRFCDNHCNSIEFSIKKYNESLEFLHSGYLDSINDNNLKIKSILSRNYLNEDVDVNKYYFTLESADFRSCFINFIIPSYNHVKRLRWKYNKSTTHTPILIKELYRCKV